MLKSFSPIIVLLIVAFYGYQKYPLLPDSASIGISYLVYMLALIVAGLSVRFSRSRLFYYVLLIMITNLTLRSGWASGELRYGLLSAILPLLLVTLTILPDRGVISAKAIPAYVILLLAATFTAIVATMSPAWATYLVLTDWVPARYFDWTGQAQSVLIVSFAALYVMLTLATLNPSLYLAAGCGVLFMLVTQLHFGGEERSLSAFSGAALLMCLYAIMQDTWRMAYLDELTGLPGRRALGEKLQRLGGTYTVAMLDVDHFKKFNDNYGHSAGDTVLRMIASKMSKVSGGGLPYRYGGEEFAILFSGKNLQEAARHLENLRVDIANKPFVIRRAGRRSVDKPDGPDTNKSIRITVSIGFAESNRKELSPWDVVKLADQALYRAKGKGRNCISE
ncbi:MAG: GGDEF domain-containing protein [Gammaproteobacteria bacterium]|nr:GGDEF domain-containing protein [Gammaproteobacteria bacterium]MDH3450501.1 GGDEF domain-containing protein [Gammaproteobacteria bacterium]